MAKPDPPRLPPHVLNSLLLILLSLIFLPLDTFVLFAAYALRILVPSLTPWPHRRSLMRSPAFRQRTVLITGVSMAKGLFLARTFHNAGHRVVGADFEPHHIPVSGRFSAALTGGFHRLPLPTAAKGSESRYINALLHIIQTHHIDLWIPVSGATTEFLDARAAAFLRRRAPSCGYIIPSAPLTYNLHDKYAFTARAAAHGLRVPDTHRVTTRHAVHAILQSNSTLRGGALIPTRYYILKPVGDSDPRARGPALTLLPRPTLNETYTHVSALPLSSASPHVLQQFVPGGRELCSHALVVRGCVRAFVACESGEMLMHYAALDPCGGLSRAARRWTEAFVAKEGEGLSGHVAFDFMVEERVNGEGKVESVLWPIECNPRVHTAVLLFGGLPPEDVVAPYLEALEGPEVGDVCNGIEEPHKPGVEADGVGIRSPTTGKANGNVLTPPDTPPSTSSASLVGLHQLASSTSGARLETEKEDAAEIPSVLTPPTSGASPEGYYFLPHDLIMLLFLPILHLLSAAFSTIQPTIRSSRKSSFPSVSTALAALVKATAELLRHILFWKDGTWELWDPLPAWWAVHGYWPAVFAWRSWAGMRAKFGIGEGDQGETDGDGDGDGYWERVNFSTGKVWG